MPRAEGMLGFAFSDAPGAEPGFRLDGQGRVRSVHGIEELGQSLTMLLSTRPGERPLAPDYGCPLDLIAFEPNDATTAGLAIRLVADAVERFEPRAEILMIDAGADPGRPGFLIVELDYRDRRDDRSGHITHTVKVAG